VDYGVTTPNRFTITSGQFGSTIGGTASEITVGTGTNDILATIGMGGGLTSSVTDTFDVTNPASTSNFSTSLSIFDSLGDSHTLTVYFRKIATGLWEWFGAVDGGDITSGQVDVLDNPQVGGTAWIGAYGTLGFGTDGKLIDDVTTTSRFDFADATQNQVIGFEFGSGTNEVDGVNGTGLDGTTQFAGISTVLSQSQDGYGPGSLQSVSIGEDGIIVGSFTNGQTQDIAQIALAKFVSNQGLSAIGRNLFAETAISGQPTIGQAGRSGLGNITSNSLELSNVDLATEFVNMIKYQQGFMASSRIITTTDRLLTELVNIGR
jgi:flagellar hook protein FlgE